MLKPVLFFALLLASITLHAQRAPRWITQPPAPDAKWVYGIGISDIGLDLASAKRQAISRARTLAAIAHSAHVTSTVVSSSVDGELSGLELDPRNSYAVDIVSASCEKAAALLLNTFSADSVTYALVKIPRSACTSGGKKVTVRYFRDDSRGFTSASFTLDSPADSVLIYADELDNHVEYRSGWPELTETEQTKSAGALRSSSPAWLTTLPAPDPGTYFSFDVSTHNGRFAPFLSFLQAFILSKADAVAKAGPEQIISEDPYEYQGKTMYATQTVVSNHRSVQSKPLRIHISRAGRIYQTSVQTAVKIPSVESRL